MATKHRYHVVGPRVIAGVAPGRTVTLDPEQVDIEALIEAGHISLKPPSAPEPETKPKEGDE